jgi:hypothetical protein
VARIEWAIVADGWPMLTVPFLTDLDSRAAVKGSRDPLGIQSIWTRFGRQVVGNLTTVSSSVRDFTTLLLGVYFAQRVAEDLGPGTELATFLKWEQLAAYARAEGNKDYSFRGTERARKALSESSRVTLSDDRSHQILSNQKIYGIWGLYSVPARSSGLLERDPPELTLPARELVEHVYLEILGKEGFRDGKRIVALLREPTSRVDVQGAESRLVGAIARVLNRRLLAPEREFYRLHLLYGGPQDSTDGRQRQLAALLHRSLSLEGFAWSPQMVGALAKEARVEGQDWQPLADRLDRIRRSETVLAPISALFSHLLGLDGREVDFVVKRVREEWGSGLRTIALDGIRELTPEFGGADIDVGERWVAIAEAAASGQYGVLLDLLIKQNRWVMEYRGGAPWIEQRDRRLHVRLRDDEGALPSRATLSTLWRFPYFLDSLRQVAIAVKESSSA